MNGRIPYVPTCRQGTSSTQNRWFRLEAIEPDFPTARGADQRILYQVFEQLSPRKKKMDKFAHPPAPEMAFSFLFLFFLSCLLFFFFFFHSPSLFFFLIFPFVFVFSIGRLLTAYWLYLYVREVCTAVSVRTVTAAPVFFLRKAGSVG